MQQQRRFGGGSSSDSVDCGAVRLTRVETRRKKERKAEKKQSKRSNNKCRSKFLIIYDKNITKGERKKKLHVFFPSLVRVFPFYALFVTPRLQLQRQCAIYSYDWSKKCDEIEMSEILQVWERESSWQMARYEF